MIDSLLTAAIGLWLALVGFGKVRLSKDPVKNKEIIDKYALTMRIGGIILAVIGIVLTLVKI